MLSDHPELCQQGQRSESILSYRRNLSADPYDQLLVSSLFFMGFIFFYFISGFAGGHHLLLFQWRSKTGLCPFIMCFRLACTCTHTHTNSHFPFVIRDRPGNFLCMTFWARGMSWQTYSSRVFLRIKDYLLLASNHALYSDCYQLCKWLICIQNYVFLPEVHVNRSHKITRLYKKGSSIVGL